MKLSQGKELRRLGNGGKHVQHCAGTQQPRSEHTTELLEGSPPLLPQSWPLIRLVNSFECPAPGLGLLHLFF